MAVLEACLVTQPENCFLRRCNLGILISRKRTRHQVWYSESEYPKIRTSENQRFGNPKAGNQTLRNPKAGNQTLRNPKAVSYRSIPCLTGPFPCLTGPIRVLQGHSRVLQADFHFPDGPISIFRTGRFPFSDVPADVIGYSSVVNSVPEAPNLLPEPCLPWRAMA